MTEQPAPPRVDPEQLLAAATQLRAALDAWAAAVLPAALAAVQQLAAALDHARQAPPATLDRPNRPAWRSPYGPAHRRR
ncbi:hypothetical protein [Streptomyces sp. 3211]|uniref:hypothetical protein n=1 Tax=Streptomyces sp. 3211 TaxID=1964449 RepID=UPI0009A4D6BF|nr:hypothetical protein [Streptomyces sp. 3211]